MVLIVSSLILILGCKEKGNVELVLENVITFNTPIGFYPNRVAFLKNDKDTNIVLFDWRQGDLYFYHNSNVTHNKYNGYNAIFVKSLDSIYLIDKYKGNILLINNKFDSINTWIVPRLINKIPYLLNSNLKTNFIDLNGKFYLTVYPNIHRDSFYTKYNEIIYSLAERKIEKLYKKFPSNYSKINYWNGIGDFVIKSINSKNEIFFMYPMNKNVFKMSDNKIEEIELPNSKFLKDFPPEPYPYPTPESSKFNSEFSIKTPSYTNFIFDKYRNLYYKIVNHPQPIRNGNLKNTYNSKSWSIMIFNEEFELLNEIEMEGNKYFNNYFYIMKDGIYVLMQDEDNFDGNNKIQKIKVNYDI